MQRSIVSFVAVFAILLAQALTGTAQGSVIVDRVVAVVNNDIITLSDLQREATLSKSENRPDEKLVLENMIDRKLQMAAAKRAGMDVTDKELADALADITKRNNLDMAQFGEALAKEGLTIDQYKNELREQMTLSRLFNKYVRSGIAVDEAEARTFYEQNARNFSLPEEIRVRQLFLALPEKATPAQSAAVKEKAQAAYQRAKKGEDFIKIIREVSQGVTAKQDGDLGFIQRDEVIAEIADATRSLKPGELSSPFISAGGYNIIRLEEVRIPVRPFAKVKDEITKTLYEQKVENTYRGWLQTLRGDSQIDNRL